ncbi:MAG: DUF2065 domain-containing protein [Desulfomonilia bacterium]|jgi:uncharacterized protein YjeT (DUF2065 family)|nr:DUF2065 domain-containing protein [Desulfomonilia bacterium]HPW68153.1 DUF2065 domain-containing protein [Deltaproteobacteria bacterium]
MDYFLSVLGMVFVIEALPYIAFPSKVKEFARYLETVPDRTLQVIGVIVAFAGLAVVYLGRRLGGM